MCFHKRRWKKGIYLTKSTPDWWAVKESCDIQKLGDKKACIIHSGPLVEVSPADILHGCGLSVLSSAHRMPDGIFNGVLHDVWMLSEAIQDISLENSILQHKTSGQCTMCLWFSYMLRARLVTETADTPGKHQAVEGGAHTPQSSHRIVGFVHKQKPSTDVMNNI